MAKAECGNCDWEGDHEDGDMIRDIHQRVEPGEPMPACECPECGALCHLSDAGDAEGQGDKPDLVRVALPAGMWGDITQALEEARDSREEERDHGGHDPELVASNDAAFNKFGAALEALQAEIRG